MAAKSEKSATSKSAATKTTTRRTTTSKRKAAPEISDELIAERAYLLHLDDPGASEVDNWLRAESELRAN